MKNLQLCLLVFMAVLFASCAKDNPVDPNTPITTCLIQKVAYADGGTVTYTYDATNRMTKSVTAQGAMVSESDYTYSGKTVVATSGGSTMSTTYLNDSGFADSIMISIPGFFELKTVNTFNSSGQVVSSTTSGTQFGTPIANRTTIQYAGGNISREVTESSTDTSTINYEYYLDKVDQSKKSQQAMYFINSNVNLKKKATYSDGNVTTYTYECDADGKAIKSIAVRAGAGAGTQINTFTWSCK